MNLNPDLHHHYALDRQQRLRDEAAAHRLADRDPGTHPDRAAPAACNRPAGRGTAASGPVGKALTQRS